VSEDTALRNELRKAGVEYSVVKNTLVRRALDDAGLSELDDVLNGTTSLAVSKEDPIAPMRVLYKFAKGLEGERFAIKAGFMDGKVLPLDDVIAMAELPSKEVMLGQLLGMMLAPITSLAIVIKAIAEKGGVPAEKAEETAPAAEEAPAAEAPAAEEALAAEAPAAEEAAPETPAE
ncbi:MAG: 50S ribosomal protein L10, partial [Oscillospiraceae bacterium]|nr:50S ribosomal protein L10 [Oscillospiraceae bacterium]